MDIKLIQNAIIIEISVNENHYNFFLDSGFPFSFSKDLTHISNLDLKIENEFKLDLQKSTVDTSDLEKHLGIKLSGFLGLNFIQKFENFSINLIENKIEFNALIDYDFSLPMLSVNPIITNFSIENIDKNGFVLFDTGAFQSMFFDLNDLSIRYKSSKGWAFPSAFGKMLIDYYAEIPIYFEKQNLGNYTFGYPSNLPRMPFKYVLGLNFMSEFIVNLNFKRKTIDFKKNSIKNNKIFKLNSDIYSIGIQVIFENNAFIVSNILAGFENKFLNVNDKIIFNEPVDINSFYNSITSNKTSRNIELNINGKNVILQTMQIFK